MNGDMAASDAMASRPAKAELRDPNGRQMGEAFAKQEGASIHIRVVGMNLPQGVHGAHVHAVGACTAPAFESAGPHWNPNGAMHGKDNPAGMHKGDLPNITVGPDGRGSVDYDVAGAQVDGLLDSDGGALVIHAAADDYRTDPSGNSGARIACGVFTR